MNIAYSCNEKYIVHTGISIVSLLENQNRTDNISIYLLGIDVSLDSIALLSQLVLSYNAKFYYIDFNDISFDLVVNNLGRHVPTVYSKLFFERISALDKVIYLDSDIIIKNSLQELWEIDLKRNYFACVKTVTKSYSNKLGLSVKEDFFNDGMAVVNVDLIRKDNLLKIFLNFIDKCDGNPPVLSEGVINVCCKGRILPLHPKFNLMSSFFMYSPRKLLDISCQKFYYSKDVIEDAKNNVVGIHYLSGWYNRPWNLNCSHPLRKEYLYYKSISPWFDFPLDNAKKPANIMKMFLIKFIPFRFVVFYNKYY
ncbi:lipopolysaccharide biosynthesis glycosyltransferase [Algoriphagus ratkowskyi]|uniref:Lipopolysaccharide biosynthesis glycosyltransferase n=1 Tax=Algoriphagus ratkowskyi TaxID=57028 RepID=A0A2W7RHM2_9BACT|nr:glycosyltransferase [Algoriphagus ratkowskyi]PZX50265.1 lipopolysaccharide biosynthesis glycosyltransferase [Algoriphagus ratkowskyi]TXD75617.1 hypothetical protein ESW18_19765 [Algoriphagus ratkowskyi]